MARSGFVSIGFLLIFIAASNAFGQVQPGAAAASKIVIVNTAAFFDEKAGIAKIVAASKQLSTDLAPGRSDVQRLITRLDALEKEIAAFQQNVKNGIPIDEKTAQAKVDEAERLKREGKFKEDEFNSLAEKRQSQVVGPVYADAMRVLADYIKSKGYGIVFDVSKDQNGFLIYATEQYDITKDFIAFYNSRPPTAIGPVPKQD